MIRGSSWLSGKHVLITGASDGIGKELAKNLVGICRRLSLVSRNTGGGLDEFKQYLDRDCHGRTEVRAYTLDICNALRMRELVTHIYDTDKDQVDVFINCAGGTHIYGTFETMSMEDINQIFDTNAKAPIFWLRELLPRMKYNKLGDGDQKRAHIVMLSSRSAERTLANLSVYTAAKGSIEKLTEAMQKEYARYKMVFTLINPGSINTGFTNKWDEKTRKAHNAEALLVDEAIQPILHALDMQFAVNKISYESTAQWLVEPGVLKDSLPI